MGSILLISFAGYPSTPSSLMPDNGLASLAGCLTAAGHDVRILDYNTVSTLGRLFPEGLSERVEPLARRLFVEGRDLNWWQKLRFLKAGWALGRHQRREIDAIAAEAACRAEELGVEFVGLKLWNGDGFSGSVKIAESVKERLPHVKVIGGGPQVDYFHRHILEYTSAFDVLVRGEGERVLRRLLRTLSEGGSLEEVPGLLWREGGRIRETPPEALEDLDELPLPLYEPEVYPALQGDEKIKVGVVDESRGCPNRCAFCIHPIKSGRNWSLKCPGRVLEEMRTLMDQVGTRYFVYSGSNTSARVAVNIARAIVREGLQVRYGCFGHVRAIARADFDLLRQSGCEAIFYGLESGSPRVLREGFNKPLDLEKAARVIRQTRGAGITAIASVIYPGPFEDAQSRAQTMAFLQRVRPDSVPVTIPGMIPGTPWEREPERYGFEKLDRKDIWEYALTYKIRLLYPPSLWKPLPYRLNGKSSKELFGECEQFINDVEAAGILTNVPHEMVLMAEALGERDDLRGFRDRCRAAFLGGDVETVRRLVTTINEHVRPEVPVRQPALQGQNL